jgi:TatD DNase family protein
VSGIIEVGESPASWPKALELARAYENIYAAIGVHPCAADEYSDFSGLIASEKVVAIGECGLDYHWKDVPRKLQIEAFEKQLELAETSGKPVIIHCREAEPDAFAILKGHGRLAGVIHCFSSDAGYAEKFLELGFYIGIDGPVTYPSAANLKAAVAAVPAERILLETDCPYLPAQPFRGKRNEPAYIKYAAECIAGIKNIPIIKFLEITDCNTERLFGIRAGIHCDT